MLPRLRRYAYALTGARHDADDLLQATLERLLVKGVPEAVEVDKWAFRVCRNLWIDEIRARRVRSAVPLEESGAMEQTFDGEGLSYAQAAEVLETPIGTIMSRIARARAALSKALRAESPQTSAGLATGAG